MTSKYLFFMKKNFIFLLCFLIVNYLKSQTIVQNYLRFYDDGGKYGNVGKSKKSWTFMSTEGKTLKLFFSNIDIPSGSEIKVYLGNQEKEENLLSRFTGIKKTKNIEGEVLTVVYNPSSKGEGSGWEAIIWSSIKRNEIHGKVTASLPESDCPNAIPICSNSTINTSANQYEDTGLINDDEGGCYSGTGEGGSVWYKFKPLTSGMLDFTITPTGSTDYDFVLWDITSGCENKTELSCNFAAPSGPTGLSSTGEPTNSQDANGTRFNQRISVDATKVYALCINYYSGNNAGFTLTFKNEPSSVDIIDNVPPTIINAFGNSCSNSTQLEVFFSEYLDCSTLQATDFTIAGYTIGLVSTNCSGTPSKTNKITLSVSPPLPVSATYTLFGQNVNDLCGNVMNHNYNLVFGTPPTAVAGPDKVVCRSPGFLGIGYNYTTVTLTASGGTNYVWSDGQTGSSINVSPTSPTIYTVTVQNGACTSTDQVFVDVQDSPLPDLGGTITICAGFPVTLNSGLSSTGLTFEWQSTTSSFLGVPIGFSTIPGQSSPTLSITPSAPTTWYRVIVTSPGGCTGNSTVRVNQGAGTFGITASQNPI